MLELADGIAGGVVDPYHAQDTSQAGDIPDVARAEGRQAGQEVDPSVTHEAPLVFRPEETDEKFGQEEKTEGVVVDADDLGYLGRQYEDGIGQKADQHDDREDQQGGLIQVGFVVVFEFQPGGIYF